MNLNNEYLKLAIQKDGRLTEETLAFLRQSGLEFDSFTQKLFSKCRNFPLDIVYVRDDDIQNYVTSSSVDLGIVGQNLLYEKREKVKKLLNLRFGFCSLVVAVPRDSLFTAVADLNGKTLATSYPVSTETFFKKNNIEVKIVQISGALEIVPALGIAQGIVDLSSSGSTLALNDLRILTKIYDSEAILIGNNKSINSVAKKILTARLLTRFKGVLSAKNYKYVLFNASKKELLKFKKLLPNIQTSQTVAQSIIKEDFFWEVVEKLKKLGACNIKLLPIEKIIN